MTDARERSRGAWDDWTAVDVAEELKPMPKREDPCRMSWHADEDGALHGCGLDRLHIKTDEPHACAHAGCERRMAVNPGERMNALQVAYQELSYALSNGDPEKLEKATNEVDELWPYVRAGAVRLVAAWRKQGR